MNPKLFTVLFMAVSLTGCMNSSAGPQDLPRSGAVGQQMTQTPEAPTVENGLNDHNGPGTANNTPGTPSSNSGGPMNGR